MQFQLHKQCGHKGRCLQRCGNKGQLPNAVATKADAFKVWQQGTAAKRCGNKGRCLQSVATRDRCQTMWQQRQMPPKFGNKGQMPNAVVTKADASKVWQQGTDASKQGAPRQLPLHISGSFFDTGSTSASCHDLSLPSLIQTGSSQPTGKTFSTAVSSSLAFVFVTAIQAEV